MATTFLPKKPSAPNVILIFTRVAFGIFLLCLVTATILTFIAPETYASRARIALQRDATGLSTAQGTSVSGASYDQAFMQTECGVVQSEAILDAVIERLNLNDIWQKKYNVKFKTPDSRAALKRMIEVRPLRNSNLIDITVYSDDNHEAAQIANAIADAYQAYETAKARARVAQLVDEVKQELAAEGKTLDGQSEEDRISEIVSRIARRTDAEGLPRVVIVDHAEPNVHPARPNKPLNILLGGFIGIVVGFLAGTVAASISWAARPKRAAAFIL